MSELVILFCVLCLAGTQSDREDTKKNKVLRAVIITVSVLIGIISVYQVAQIVINY